LTLPALTLTAVGKTYRMGPPWARRTIEALQPLSLNLARGEMTVVIGESGSGKTTLAKLCLGLIRPSTGSLAFNGETFPGQPGRLRGRLAAVLQNPAAALNPALKVHQSIAEPMRLAGLMSHAEIGARVAELLEQVRLPAALASRFPAELSGGQRQRVTIARALSTTPDLIVFDEAVSALDVSVQAQVLNLIDDLKRQVGFAGLFITHDVAVARYIGDGALVIREGRVEAEMVARDLYHPAENLYARGLQTASGLFE